MQIYVCVSDWGQTLRNGIEVSQNLAELNQICLHGEYDGFVCKSGELTS